MDFGPLGQRYLVMDEGVDSVRPLVTAQDFRTCPVAEAEPGSTPAIFGHSGFWHLHFAV